MRRARLHEAALRADAGAVVDWAALAADLGYADQAHLTREFTATLGVPPSPVRLPRRYGFRGFRPTPPSMSMLPGSSGRRTGSSGCHSGR